MQQKTEFNLLSRLTVKFLNRSYVIQMKGNLSFKRERERELYDVKNKFPNQKPKLWTVKDQTSCCPIT